MKLFLMRILRFVIFAAGLVLILAGLSHVLVPKDNTAVAGMEEVQANGILGEKKDTVDVVMIGDSESYSAFSPMELWKTYGYTGYVCGSSAQHLPYTKMMVKRAFQNQSPKVVLLEADNIYAWVALDKAALGELEDHSDVFMYHNRWKTFHMSELGKKIQYTYQDTNKGYYYKDETVVPTPEAERAYMADADTARIKPIEKVNRLYVKEIQKICDAHDAKLVLVSVPNMLGWSWGKHNGISALAKEMGIDFLDLNTIPDEVGIDWQTDSRDGGDHMNHRGARKVSACIGSYLADLNILPDHRGDAGYTEWDEDLAVYEEETKGTA